MNCLYAAIFIILIAAVHSRKLPPNFKKCNRKDPDFNVCLKSAIQDYLTNQSQAPIKEVGLVSLNPLTIPVMELKAAGSNLGLEQKYRNANFSGYTNLKVNKFDIDFDKKSIVVNAEVDQLRFDADYEATGQILVLPVHGAGKCKIVLDVVNATNWFTFELVEKGGKNYIKVITSVVALVPSKKVTFFFENIFNGNKAISDNVNNVINDNWELVYADAKTGFEETLAKVHMQLANNVFSKISVSEMFD